MRLTCRSCAHYRPRRCAAGRFWEFPSARDGGQQCRWFSYELGSDEAEDEDHA
jgi:hypothetical protein